MAGAREFDQEKLIASDVWPQKLELSLADGGQRRGTAALRSHPAPLFSATFSRDCKRVLTASEDRTARLWRNFGTTQQLIDYPCPILPRPLTHEQRRREFILADDLKDWACPWTPDRKDKPDAAAQAAR